MFNKRIREKIEARAFEIYSYRTENNIAGSSLDDWFQAESEIITDRRMDNGCPKCNFKLLARRDDKIICLRCDFEIEAKRKLDKDMPDFSDIKKDWQ